MTVQFYKVVLVKTMKSIAQNYVNKDKICFYCFSFPGDIEEFDKVAIQINLLVWLLVQTVRQVGLFSHLGEIPRGVMAKVLDCEFEIREFEIQSRCFRLLLLRKVMNPLILPAMG